MRANDGGWRGKYVLGVTDNLGNAVNVNKGTARSAPERAIIRELHARAEAGGYWLCSTWVAREFNTGPDALSKSATRAEATATCVRLGLRLLASP